MEIRPLRGTELKTSRLALGTMTFGSQVDQAEATTMVQRCLDAGINHFDTANVYNGGAAEEILGKALGARRADVILATKIRMPMGAAADEQGLSAPAIHTAIEASLRRLGTDHVDLYYLHQPDWSVPIAETLGAMAELVTAGKVRCIAISNYAAWQIAQIRNKGADQGWPPVHVSQVMYNLIARHLDEEYAAFSRGYDMSNVVYNPLAGGLLTGKHRRETEPAAGTRFTTQHYRQRYWNDRQFAAVDQLTEVAAANGLSLIELSYRWLLSQDIVDAVLVGASSVAQLDTNLAAAAGPALDTAVQQQCDEAWQWLRGPIPKYNR